MDIIKNPKSAKRGIFITVMVTNVVPAQPAQSGLWIVRRSRHKTKGQI
jgi:hypothetical protein